jgi:TrmH family RNA methyltransferase
MIITSDKNELIKKIKKLNNKKDRYESGLFFVEGRNNVSEVLKSKFSIRYIIISENYNNNIDFDLNRIIKVPDNLFKKISDTVTPQNIMAIVRIPRYELNTIIDKNSVYIIADEVQNPGNLGTIIRTADAFKVRAVFTINNSVDIYNPKVIRSAMGSIFHIPVVNIDDVDELMNRLKKSCIKIYSTDLKADQYIFDFKISNNAAFIFGNEAKGVNPMLNRYIDGKFKIPMTGNAESLNVSITASICLYESQRQRLIK